MDKVTHYEGSLKTFSGKTLITELHLAQYREGKFDLLSFANKTSVLDARYCDVPIKHRNEMEVKLTLVKLVSETLDYFGSGNITIAKMLIEDILREFRNFTILDICKAISEGRVSGGEMFGKLHGGHFITWIRNYDSKLGEEIAKFERNKNFSIEHTQEERNVFKSLLNSHLERITTKDKVKKQEVVKKHEKMVQDFNVIKPATDRTLAIREWQDIEGEKMSLEDYLKEKNLI